MTVLARRADLHQWPALQMIRNYDPQQRTEESIVNKNSRISAFPVAADHAAPLTAHQPRRLPVATLINTTALLATTALLFTAGPKLPPYQG
jgi:hypothetical protein